MSFSPSPRYLLVTLLDEIEKKQNADSEATALASSVLPVPSQWWQSVSKQLCCGTTQ
jgi:hypothetical protein